MEPEARGGVPIPEAWIGKRITFAGPHHLVGVLTEVNDRGVVISYTGTQRRTQGGFPKEVEVETHEARFFPWEQVQLLRYVEEEQANDQT